MTKFGDKMRARGMTLEGAEIPDPRPLAPPVGFVRQPSMIEQVRKMMAAEFARRGDNSDESPEDAADMGDDEEEVVEALSQYERYDLEMELARRTDAENARKAAVEPAQASVPDPPADGPGAPKKPGKAPKGSAGGPEENRIDAGSEQ